MDHPKCPYCGKAAKFVKGDKVYPHRPDLAHKGFWCCEPCDARVGCHPSTNTPLGDLASGELRQARSRVHAAFDPLWRGGHDMRRSDAYRWLALEMDLKKDECHVGMFDLERCAAALEAIERINEHIENSLGPPCPNCRSIEHCGITRCLACHKPLCEDCSVDNMHFTCEAEARGGLYMGTVGELEV
jgi:zinc-finger-containing domain